MNEFACKVSHPHLSASKFTFSVSTPAAGNQNKLGIKFEEKKAVSVPSLDSFLVKGHGV